jgi:hypothetical protein
MAKTEPSYFTAFKNFAPTRTPSGVLAFRFHTDGGPATFTGADARATGSWSPITCLDSGPQAPSGRPVAPLLTSGRIRDRPDLIRKIFSCYWYEMPS